jgi:hypothetical protein
MGDGGHPTAVPGRSHAPHHHRRRRCPRHRRPHPRLRRHRERRPDRDCPDFASQADAQAAFDAVPGDPERLDADDDGIACEDRFGSPDQQVQVLPSGGVDTGGDPVDG